MKINTKAAAIAARLPKYMRDTEDSLDALSRLMSLVLEEAAKLVEERGSKPYAAVDPTLTAAAIRNLKP